MKTYNIGDKVKTKWDDSAKPIPAVILNKYRGHRQMRYTVRMKDETIERIDHDQIVCYPVATQSLPGHLEPRLERVVCIEIA